ncbi:MAG: SDR family NAD(P)-dependent oxidoreductase [Paucimonas sp.]|jgi:6-methylsalicylic acid synthase|nr:SDR family NAD(P)-dependent oxidoreductase [Paucimonas sp.]
MSYSSVDSERLPRSSGNDPIAIVGMSCRLAPDLTSPAQFWDFLQEGRTAVGAVPADRWQVYEEASPALANALRKATRLGCYMADVDKFDAGFFGVSAREAESLDPQQRIVLELVWEALERAGIPPSGLKGGDTGVFAAANSFDYGHRLFSDIAHIEPWALNGGMLFGIANRVSYVLDLHGPSLVVDTACAGALTALHLGCQSLWDGSTGLAIIGAVNVMSFPGMQVALDAAGATAADGRCKSFDAAADGYGRGEGAGVLILKRYADALRDGDPVQALIRGCGVHQDGRTAGMMAPNGEAQAHMLRQVYRQAGVDPLSVHYVEAHGTGTRLGDKAELTAISQVFGTGRQAGGECLVGSVKPNVGHLEAGAGMVGLIKTVLAIRHGQIPRSLYSSLTAEIDWQTAGIRVVGAAQPWPMTATPRRAGVSCFGVGGTIAHAILEAAPAAERETLEPVAAGAGLLFPLSGQSRENVQGAAARLAAWLEANPQVSLADIGHTLALRRDHLEVRSVVQASTREALLEALHSAATASPSESLHSGACNRGAGKGVVFVFSGHGAQWPGMGRELLQTEPVFAAQVDALADVFRDELGCTARDLLEQGDFEPVRHAQAATFAVQVALAALWQSKGLEPAAVIGYSIGEIAASVVAGALEKNAAARFACRRAGLYQRLAGSGGMLMVNLPFAQATQRLGSAKEVVAAIAASPRSTVLSGEGAALERIAGAWGSDEVVVRRVATDVAFHSPQIDEVLDDIRRAAGELQPCAPRIPMFNSVLPDPRSPALRDDAFWAANSRCPVLFDQAVSAALEEGFRLFVEVSSKPIVSHAIRETAEACECDDVVVCPTLREGQAQRQSLLDSLARLYSEGAGLNWQSWYGAAGLLDLPTTSWHHQRYWTSAKPSSTASGRGHDASRHTLLGSCRTIRSSPPCEVWQTHLDFESRPYPRQHPIAGVEIMPAAVLLHSFLQARASAAGMPGLRDVILRTPIAVEGERELQIVCQGKDIRLASRLLEALPDESNEADLAWVTHTTATLEWRAPEEAMYPDPARWIANCEQTLEWSMVEPVYRRRGIADYGFRWRIQALRRGQGTLVASGCVDTCAEQRNSWAVVLDAVLTMMPLLLPDDDELRMPARLGELRVSGPAPDSFTVLASVAVPEQVPVMDVLILNETGLLVGRLEGLVFATIDRKDGLAPVPGRTVFVEAWEPWTQGEDALAQATEVFLLGAGEAQAGRLMAGFVGAGMRCRILDDLAELESNGRPGVVLMLGEAPGDGETVEQNVERNAWRLLTATQQVAARRTREPAIRLGCITFGVRQLRTSSALGQSGLWGMARIIAGEQPDLWAGLIDMDPQALDEPATYGHLAKALGQGREDVLSVAAEGIHALRLQALETAPSSTESRQICRADATYLVTGGLGALGLETARYLVSQGARRLLLASRNGLPARSEWASQTCPQLRSVIERVRALERQGVTVLPLALDVVDEPGMRRALEQALQSLPAIRGVVHAAGQFAGGLVESLQRQTLRTVLQAKVDGTLALARALDHAPLDFFVLYSSSGQFARLSGQAGYASANAFMDAFARHRRSLGHNTLSLGWMAWDRLGMSRGIDTTLLEARAHGLEGISVPAALMSWQLAQQAEVPYAAVFSAARKEAVDTPLPVLRHVFAAEQPGACEAAAQTPWAMVPQAQLLPWLIDDIQAQVAAELRCAQADIGPRRSLVEKGLDSLISVALRIRLKKRYRIDIPPTLIWNHPTIEAIAKYVRGQLLSVDEPVQPT